MQEFESLSNHYFCQYELIQVESQVRMVVVSFDRVRLADRSNQLITEWWSDVEAGDSYTAANRQDTNSIFLPPMKPESLEVNIRPKEVEGGCEVEEIVRQVRLCLQDGSKFWDQLLYKAHFPSDKELRLELACQLWNSEKISTLLQRPVENRQHMNGLPRIFFLKRLNIYVNIYSSCGSHLVIDQVLPQLNEYLGSLFISQLEFRFPFVFCAIARKRFLAQESSIGPISYALSNSSALLPILAKLISDDRTATTVYQMIKSHRSRTKKTCFQIAKQIER